MDDFGIDNELPNNPFVFVLEAGLHPKYLGPLLVHSPDGNPVQGNRELIHNEKGVFHEAKVLKTGNLRLGPRRKDIEEHNVHPPDRWSVPITPVLVLEILLNNQRQAVVRTQTKAKTHFPISTPQVTVVQQRLWTVQVTT